MSPVWNQPPANAGARRVGIAPVALEHLRAAQHDLAALARGHRRAVLVPDVELEVLARPADAAELRHRALAVEERVARHRLGQAVRVGEPGRRERPAQPLDERDRHLLAAGDDHPHRRQVALARCRERRGSPGPSRARSTPHVTRDRSISSTTRCRVEHAVDDRGRTRPRSSSW